MLGNPKFKIGDMVTFNIIMEDDKEVTLNGEVCVVDKHGTFFDNSDVCYDVMANFENKKVFIKHINEKGIAPANL